MFGHGNDGERSELDVEKVEMQEGSRQRHAGYSLLINDLPFVLGVVPHGA